MDIFVGRKRELETLDELWRSPKAEFLVLYGRRRVGKTRLLTHWFQNKKEPVRVIYWAADQDNKESHLRQFSAEIFKCAFPRASIPASFSYADWNEIWEQLGEMAKNERLVVIIDEFPYVLASNPVVASQLQRAWDRVLEKTHIMLCLSGSHLGMMQKEFIDSKAPLYGRATRIMKLAQLPFGITKQYFPNYSAEERVRLYSVFGGVPHYWKQIDQSIAVIENVDRLVLSGGLLQNEAITMLHESVKEPQNYVSILKAIATGNRTPKEIESHTGIRVQHLTQYLSNLNDLGFVTRRVPVTGTATSRLGRYAITDPFLRFYFRFVASRLSQIELGQTLQVSEELRRHWVDFIGTHTWEELSQEWLIRASNQSAIPVFPDEIGGTWTNDAQVDVAGINYMTKEIVLGECKWTLQREKANVLESLVEGKTARVLPKQGTWKVFYLGFSKEGWNENAQAYAERLNAEVQKKNGGRFSEFPWKIVGMRLLSLADVDRDLALWS